MTTAQIESNADPKGLAGTYFDLKVVLRRNVVPKFLADVGYCAWRFKFATISLAASARYISISDGDFWHMKHVVIKGYEASPLTYIGDDMKHVLTAESATITGTPEGYYLKLHTDGTWRVFFDVPSNATRDIVIAYDTNIPFSDDTTSINLDQYIPKQFHWALVCGLQMKLYEDRLGIEDQRYATSKQEYGEWIARASESPNLSRGSSARGRYL